MNRSTLRKIWGDLWTRKGRTALVSISILIGVLGVVTLITAGDLLVEQLKEDVKEADLPMLSAFVSIPPAEGDVDPENVAIIDSMLAAFPDMTAAEGEANNPFYWKFPDEGRFREARLFAYTAPFGDKTLEPMRLVEGEYPVAGQNEIAVEQRMAEDMDFKVGDQIDVRMLGLDEFPAETWTISGIVFHPYNDASNQSMFVPLEDAMSISGIKGVNTLAFRFTDFATAEDQQEAVQDFINNETFYNVFLVIPSDPAENPALQNTQQFATILAVLAVVAMVVSGFLVLNVINNLVIEQRRQIGVMKSLGATRTETLAIYGGIAVSYGIIGMIPGVALGIPLGYQMAVIIGDFANTLIGDFAVSYNAIFLGIFLGLAVPIISAILPVYAGTRVSILEAMTDLGIGGSYRVGWLNRFVKRLPLPLNIKQSFNNLTQKKARLGLTVVTLTLAVTAFMGVSAVFVNINDVLQDILSAFEYQAIFQTTQPQPFDTVNNLIMENVEGVADIYPGSGAIIQIPGYVSAQSESDQVFAMGVVPERSAADTDLVEGTGWTEDPTRGGIILTSDISNAINKTVGDTFPVIIGGTQKDLELIGIVNFPFPMALLPWEHLARDTGNVTGAPVPNRYFTQVQIDGYNGTLPNDQITAWGIDEQTAAFLPSAEGESLMPGTPGVLLSQAAAENGGYAVGDEVTIEAGSCIGGIQPTAANTESSSTAALDSCTDTLPVVGIIQLPGEMASAQLPTDMVVFYWRDLATLEGVSLEGTPVPNAFFLLSSATDPSVREVDEMIDQVNETLVNNGITGSFINMVQISEQASDAILSVGIVLNIASAVMAAIGAIGLITTLSIAVFERQKEIGVMRSVGAKSPTIIVQFLVEGILVGVLAWIIAAPLSVLLAWGLTNILPSGEFIEFNYPPVMWLLGFVGIVIVATISSVWPSVSAARRTVSDILRYQ